MEPYMFCLAYCFQGSCLLQQVPCIILHPLWAIETPSLYVFGHQLNGLWAYEGIMNICIYIPFCIYLFI